jgi:hypothetical protein
MDQGQAIRLIQQRLETASIMRSTAKAAAKALRMMAETQPPHRDPDMLIELAGMLEKDVAAFEAAVDVDP